MAGFDYVASDGSTGSTAHVTLGLVTTTGANNTLAVNTLAGEFSYIDGQGGNDTMLGGQGRGPSYRRRRQGYDHRRRRA